MDKILIIFTFAMVPFFIFRGADMVIVNANVYTVDPHIQKAEALAIKGNDIVAVGSNKDINNLLTASTTVIDAKKRLVLPGFNDAHLHLLGGGRSLLELDLNGCETVHEIQKRLAEAVRQHSDGEWITGRGWDHTRFNSGAWPTRDMLDVVSPKNPVYIRRVDGHIGWANSLALEKAGITADTPSPEGGEIMYDPNSGAPTGILKEAAMSFLSRCIPEPKYKDNEKAARMALGEAARLGITSIQDNSEPIAFNIYNDLFEKDELTVRVSEWLDLNMAQEPDSLEKTIQKLRRFEIPDFIRIGLLKGFVDGTLGSRTAYFFEPYDDQPGTVGLPQYSEQELKNLVHAADSLGLQIGLHCIGDKANYLALKSYQSARLNGQNPLRHRIEHAQVLRPEDIPLMANLKIIASMQPTHCTSDLRWAEKRIGKKRSAGAYAWRSILNAGGKLAFGTDWPVEPLDPMRGIYSAITRKNIETGLPVSGWFPEEALTVEEAIYCYTAGSAFAEFQEDIKGSISPGKLADIIILSKNIFEIKHREILDTKVDYTIFNGKIIHQRKK